MTTALSATDAARDLQRYPEAEPVIGPAALLAAALEFTGMIDDGRAGMLWDAGSVLIKQAVKRDDFLTTIAKARTDIGPLSSRTWRAVQRQYSKGALGQIPAGEYATVNFAIVADEKPANEAVTFRHDEDGVWRFVGYVVQR